MPIARSSSTTRMRGGHVPASLMRRPCTSGSSNVERSPRADRWSQRRCVPPCASTVRLAIARPEPGARAASARRTARRGAAAPRAGRRGRCRRPRTTRVSPSRGDGDREALLGAAVGERVDRVLDQVDQHLAELLAVGSCHDVVRARRARARCRRRARRGREAAARWRARARRGRRGRSGTPRAARSAAAPRTWRSTRSSSLEDEPGVLGVERRRRLARELLGEAARRGDRVADLVRDARRELADRGELLGVRERALDGDRRARAARRRRGRSASWSTNASNASASSSRNVPPKKPVRMKR